MALTTPNEGTDTIETAKKKVSTNNIAKKVDAYMQDQLQRDSNFFVDHKTNPLHGGANSWESLITGFFKTK